MKSESTRIIIIGGVAAGMSAASRARRNNPNAEIIVFEKSGYVSFGACGLPYYVSDDIHKAEDLIAVSLDEFRIERRIDVRLHHEAVSFNPKNKTVLLTNLENGQPVSIQYDKLIIATGARPIIPMIPGIRLENIFVLRSLENGIELKARINQGGIKKVVIVGGGYIGLEMAEAFTKYTDG
jgi:NADPH-dependent 2,4-dienoyl-CoA reductase/sulfur reductase-like enzyme